MDEALRKTPLYEAHVANKGKLVPFAGFEMAVQYPTGITAEHQAVRTAAGLFDVCHMGEFVVRGPQALDFVQKIAVNEPSRGRIAEGDLADLVVFDHDPFAEDAASAVVGAAVTIVDGCVAFRDPACGDLLPDLPRRV